MGNGTMVVKTVFKTLCKPKMAHTCDLSTQEAEAGESRGPRDLPGQQGKSPLPSREAHHKRDTDGGCRKAGLVHEASALPASSKGD